jgi:hypothetical protein
MARILTFGRCLVPVLALWAGTPPARAEPTFLPIDGSDPRYAAKDFGYEVKVLATGSRFYVTISLDEAAARSFLGARLALYQGSNLLVEARPGLEQDDPGPGRVLFFALDPRVITGGELVIRSKAIRGRAAVKDFGGFTLSVKRLLEDAIPPAALEELRKPAPAPSKNDPVSKLLKDLKHPDPFVRAAAIDLLGERKARDAIPQLIDLVADGTALVGSDNYVGSHAAAALARITGRPFSTDQPAWQRWWQEQQKGPEPE